MSRDAPTIARWCLTVRRVRFLATSCWRTEWLAQVQACVISRVDKYREISALAPSSTDFECVVILASKCEPLSCCICECPPPIVQQIYGIDAPVRLTSEIPFLCCLRNSVVQAIRRGFFRWRKRLSVLPFWNRKILLSPRM